MKKYAALLLLPALALAVYDFEVFGNNNWRMTVCNDGRLACDLTPPGGGPGDNGWQGHRYLFGAGVWFGCVVEDDTVVLEGYQPNSGGTELLPTLCRYREDGPGSELDRLYCWWRDWPPPPERFPMAPVEALSQADMWCCYCAEGPELPGGPWDTVDVDVAQTLYCFDYPLARDLVFSRYQIFNDGERSLQGCYVGLMADPDVGSPDDNIVGLWLDEEFVDAGDTFRVEDFAFVYDNDNRAYPDTWVPGAVGFKLLHCDGRTVLRALRHFSVDYEPATDEQRYLTMAGYDYRTGGYRPYDVGGEPAEVRVLMTVGPFDLEPGAEYEVWLALVGASYGGAGQVPAERDPIELARRCRWAQEIFAESFAGIVQEGWPVPAELPAVAPNPFRAAATVSWTVARAGHVDIEVLDVAGRRVRTLRSGDMPAGSYRARWDGADNRGDRVARGVYFIRLTAGGEQLVTKAVLLE